MLIAYGNAENNVTILHSLLLIKIGNGQVMNSEWQSFLQSHNATIKENIVTDFGSPQAELSAAIDGTIIVDLSHQGLIAAEGADSEIFLQGQLTNDVKRVGQQQSQLTAYCSPKGRMLASMRLFQRDDSYYLELPRSILEPTLKRLRMFVLRSQVTLEDASDSLARFGIAGPDAESLLTVQLPTLPAEVDQVVQHDGITVIRIPGLHPRFEVHGPANTLSVMWEALQSHTTPAGYPAWSWLDTVSGVPSVVAETVDAFVPQMANLHSLGGISFKKGCYTGQEVVARMHYLGKLKRRMYRAHVDIDTVPTAGDLLFANGEEEASAGKVVLAQPAPQGGVDLLAVLQIASVEAGDIHLQSANGPKLEFLDLPYEVTNEA